MMNARLSSLLRRRDALFAVMLSSLALLLSCDRESVLTPAEPSGSVTLAARFQEGTKVPNVGWVRLKLDTGAYYKTAFDTVVSYVTGKSVTFGAVKSGSTFRVTLEGRDSIGTASIVRWWGSQTGTAGTAATQAVTIATDSAKTPAVLDSLSEVRYVGDTLRLPVSGTLSAWYTTDGTDPRLVSSRFRLTSELVLTKADTLKIAVLDSASGRPNLWSPLRTICVVVPNPADTSTAIASLKVDDSTLAPVGDRYTFSVAPGATTIRLNVTLQSSQASLAVNKNSKTPNTELTLSLMTDSVFVLAVTNKGKPSTCTLTVTHRAAVAAPTFSSQETWFMPGATINVSGDNGTSLLVKIHDGEWKAYENPIPVTDTLILKAKAYVGQDTSGEVCDTFRLGKRDTATFGIAWKTGIAFDSLLDSRDGRIYRTVAINGISWMAENLAFRDSGTADSSGRCYLDSTVKNAADTCSKYGRLYKQQEAPAVCPAGWTLPSQAQATALLSRFQADSSGWALKSLTGWKPYGTYNDPGYGADSLGLRLLPAGTRLIGALKYEVPSGSLQTETRIWTAEDGMYAKFTNASAAANGSGAVVTDRYSVRCVKQD